MKIHVVITDDRDGNEIYWTGEMTKRGMPSVSEDIEQAKAFASATEAYELAAQHHKLSWFKVGERKL